MHLSSHAWTTATPTRYWPTCQIRSNACAAHSFPAFCCTAYSKSPELGFRIAGNDGAPLAPTPSSNNIQIVYIDARHPPWSLPNIHEGDIWFFPCLPCRAASAFGLPRPRTTTSVALNSNLVSAHSLWPPQKLGTPYRILLNKSMILLNLGKT